MAQDTADKHSKRSAFGPPAKQQQGRLFRIYNHYRVVISLMLLGLLLSDPLTTDSKFRWLEYYQAGVVTYLAINGFTALLLLAGFQPRQRHITLSILIDILVMHGLLLASTGITNGLANLVIISVAAGNILTPSRIGTFYAALEVSADLDFLAHGEVALSGAGQATILTVLAEGITVIGHWYLYQ